MLSEEFKEFKEFEEFEEFNARFGERSDWMQTKMIALTGSPFRFAVVGQTMNCEPFGDGVEIPGS